ncbi:MAG: gamma-glutamylcyclotransferase [Rhodospirillaceae bacterium]|nr:gamma-glutamylcyclotransferase [Alphaproteobacteria bacterium]MBR72949.1 gamma-glutamylcyclotransferase [Rhodospirillaceae bacterium]|tara:strand:- start:1381 stop:1935 length:555 start_codon:yes stop_codon:yes gene_type:complete
MDFKQKDIWVFAYGSLLWNPGFSYVDSNAALLRGYHRSLCIYSHRYRGTPNLPGLVVGLDNGGSCRGVAYKVPAASASQVLRSIDRREILYNVYTRKNLRVKLYEKGTIGRSVMAFTYVANRKDPQYASKINIEEKIKLIKQGKGSMGSSIDYVKKTVQFLDHIGLPDTNLEVFLSLLLSNERK